MLGSFGSVKTHQAASHIRKSFDIPPQTHWNSHLRRPFDNQPIHHIPKQRSCVAFPFSVWMGLTSILLFLVRICRFAKFKWLFLCNTHAQAHTHIHTHTLTHSHNHKYIHRIAHNETSTYTAVSRHHPDSFCCAAQVPPLWCTSDEDLLISFSNSFPINGLCECRTRDS